ncbi:putative AC9 transposase [Purpureocillium lavendulum]|uniref:AC9 transposase n=1 Tax=Purpureocillium lavendulum TaxID=1247861 RepID=A0AB34FG73_9HYPO|nr:putative AC9 transposase [Purpureocillium lavendulum]
MKNAKERDHLSQDPELNVLCFEMEAAGLMNNFPCLVIRGICDYSDSHKNDEWHKYAALAAAAYAREFLHVLRPAKVVTLPAWADRLLEDVSATSMKADKIIQYHLTQEQRVLLDWLTPIDYGLQQSDYLARRQPGTGQWLLESEEFQVWLARSKQTLFCPGIPGAGKTILASIVIDKLDSMLRNDPKAGLAYIYCNFQRQEEQSLDHLLASVVKQLAGRQPSVLGNVKAVYDRHELSRTRPSLEEITGLLQIVAPAYSRVFIIVDALDECQGSGRCRARFISELFDLQKRHEINILTTSRFIPEVVDRFKSGVSLEIRASAKDVARYLEHHIQELPTLVQEDRQLQEEITLGILEAVDGMFLLAPIYLISLQDCITPNEIRSSLELFPKHVQGQGDDRKVEVLARAYDEAMRRIHGQRPRLKELAMEVLSWITFAKRQLTTSELQHALATKTGKPELDRGDLPHIGDMVSVCAGLVTVDGKSDIIRLVHYTTQEYLMRAHKQWFPEAESVITATCVTYLSFTVFKGGYCSTNTEFETRLRSNPFYDYASRNWGHHALMDVEPSQAVISFLSNNDNVEASSQALMAAKRYKSDRSYGVEVPRNITGLHLAAYFGMCNAAETLLEIGYGTDVKDAKHRTPLWYAARAGHRAVVKLLLAAGSDANVPASGDYGPTALQATAREGHLNVIEDLLAARADVNTTAARMAGQTALQAAAGGGHLAVVEKLLAAGADVNAAAGGIAGQTALQAAAGGGHLAVVEKLLAVGADVSAAAAWIAGQTALQAAAGGGHLAVVEKLLTAGAGANAAAGGIAGQTALQAGAMGGHLGVVEKLLAAGANVNAAAGGIGVQTVLQGGAGESHPNVVMELRTNVIAVAAEVTGLTMLQGAVEEGHQMAVDKLLTAGADINAAAAAVYGRTVLQAAAEGGHLGLAKNPPAAAASSNAAASGSTKGRTELQGAAYNRYLEVTEKLVPAVAEIGVALAAAGVFGRTALQAAAGEGHLQVVGKLLAEGADANAAPAEMSGRTALQAAAERGHLEVVEKLLASGADIKSPAARYIIVVVTSLVIASLVVVNGLVVDASIVIIQNVIRIIATFAPVVATFVHSRAISLGVLA